MAGVIAIISPEKRIDQNPFDVDAWNLLLREAQTKPIDRARNFYESLVLQFPNAGRYWKAFIEHELRGKNYENVEKLFQKCLMKVLNIDLWKCYLYYVRETKGSLPSFREKMAQAYDFALEKVGLDMYSYQVYHEYVAFLKAVPAQGHYAENQRIAAVRKVYHRGIVTPILNVEQLWAEYCNFEKGVNVALAEKLIADKNRDYQSARRVAKSLESVTRGLSRQTVSVPPRGTPSEMKQLDLWKKFIAWEKSNPMQTEDLSLFTRRVVYSYEQALLCLGYYPDLWYEAALFMQEASKTLAEREAKLSQQLAEDVSSLFDRATNTLLKDSPLMYFAYADYEEERMKFRKVESIYSRLIEMPKIDPTLAYIQYMKFSRRTDGIKAARAIFKRAREDPRSKFHVFVAAALMEYYCSKDTNVAMRIFDLGLKKFGDEPEFAKAFIDFLSHLNEDNNTRVLFERILTSGNLAPEKSLEIWDRYLEFESQVGDLSSILKVDKRRREALEKDFSSLQTLLLIDRYKFLDLIPCTDEQLKLLGYTRGMRSLGSLSTSMLNSERSTQNSTNAGRSTAFELNTAYPRPDVNQMIPFKPKIVTTSSYHPVSGGIFPPPPAVAHLMQLLPPPWCFNGPFVSIEMLMNRFRDMTLPDEVGKPEEVESLLQENGVLKAYQQQKMDEVKKEFYQLLATTPDPMQVLSDESFRPTSLKRPAKAISNADSDDEGSDLTSSGPPTKDVYRMRQQYKKVSK